jgi:ABC-type sugar transport system ATPase subunit
LAEALIEFDRITKTFAGVTALDGVSLSIRAGECHALMGENGAGKSTLGKVLAGIHRPDAGTLRIGGMPRRFASPADAAAAGIGVVHQELAFVPDLSVAENLSLGRYPRKFSLFVAHRAAQRRARELLGQIGVDLDVTRPMRTLSTAQEQLVQIASAVGTGANILVFDEPTSSLSEPEAQKLFTLIEDLKRRGVTMIYVSHRMPEVFRLCDCVSVLRDGRYVGTLDRAEATPEAVVQMMIGRAVGEYFPQHLKARPGAELLAVEKLTSPGKFANINFTLRAGEILGFAGLVGAGRSEVAQAIFGLDPAATGSLCVNDQPMPLGKVRTAMRRGIGLVPEDRKRQGLVLGMSCRSNFSLALIAGMRSLRPFPHATERREAARHFELLRVKTPSLDTPVETLSGGNQQKVVLAKWLARGGKILIVDEPTRGVDVGAKAAVHALLDELAGRGVGVLLISSELPEVINLSTRVLVMREGRIVGQVDHADATQDRVMRMMAGVTAEPAA